jgi:5-methylcytosine-specific restriction endonuclease McrA
MAARFAEHRAEENERRRKRYWTHREEELATKDVWLKEHPFERHAWNRAHPEKMRAYSSAWAKAHPEAGRAKSHRRRALLASVGGDHTPEDERQQYDRQRGRCYYCGAKVMWGQHHYEHVVPIAREESSNGPENLVIACPSCNWSKGTKLPSEWSGSTRLC